MQYGGKVKYHLEKLFFIYQIEVPGGKKDTESVQRKLFP